VLIIGVVAVVLLALGWRRALADQGGDPAAAIVELSARRLASTRPDWGRAMAAELSSLDDRSTRLRFALGCARVAWFPPLTDARSAPGARIVVVAVAAAVIGLGILVQRRADAATAVGGHGAVYGLIVAVLVLAVAGLHAWLVDRRARETSARASAARRAGITAGICLGALALLLTLPLPGTLSSTGVGNVAAMLAFPLMLVGCLVTGVVAARASGDSASGREAGVWAGRVAGSIMAVGLLATTLWAIGWFVHDPATLSAYRDTLPSAHFESYHTHFRTLAGFVSSENLDTALISALVLFPLIGLVFGAFGGLVGSAHTEHDHV
jgi:uncharacterized membrane protein